MNTTTHPNTEDIVAYLEDPQAEVFTDICLHIAHCQACRHLAEKLSVVEKSIKRDGAMLFRSESDKTPELMQAQEQNLIESYVDGQLQGEEQANIKSLIEHNPEALKSALHYASHSAAMQQELEQANESIPQPVSNPVTNSNRPEFKTHAAATWREKIQHWLNPSVWIAVPVTAMATAVLVVNLAPLIMSGNLTVASYQDKPVIQFNSADQLPGIGFFTNAHNVIKPFDKVAVTIENNDSITIRWPGVDMATSYTMRLNKIDNGQKVVIAEKTTSQNWITISGIDTQIDHRYEWVLSGKTIDAQTFYTTGGFVINRQED